MSATATAVRQNPVIALLGQPNSGKSTLFNALTGSRQHVGNWPGKTVEQKDGYFTRGGVRYTVADLPGTYSLSANSEEEIITRDYIIGGKADLVILLADASQLERSLFMLADFAGINAPAVLVLNMMDVAGDQGKKVDTTKIEKKLGIPVIPFVAADRKSYDSFYRTVEQALTRPRVLGAENLAACYSEMPGGTFGKVLELLPSEGLKQYSATWLASKALEGDGPVLELLKGGLSGDAWGDLQAILAEQKHGSLLTGDCKFRWISELLEGAVQKPREDSAALGKFDRIATSRRWGKLIAIAIILLGFVAAFLPAIPFMLLGNLVSGVLSPALRSGMTAIGAHPFLIGLLCEGVINALTFTISMVGFVLGISLAFGLIEEVGYMARISYVFDSLMARLGLHGKAAMPMLLSFGCTIGGAAGARVIDSWGQKVLAITLAWAVPCAAIWMVVPTLSGMFFGGAAPLVMVGVLCVMILHMAVTARIFGRKLVPEKDRTGLIMELPPYHKPRWGNLFRSVLLRTKDLFLRALKVILLVTVVFWLLNYSFDGVAENSVLARFGTFIEPATRQIGMGWKTFIAFISSAIGKEAVLGVLSALYAGSGDVFASTVGTAGSAANLSEVLAASVPKAEALAFIFGVTFNVPCLVALASTHQEVRSVKWTAKIAGYYVLTALIISAIVYRIGLLIF